MVVGAVASSPAITVEGTPVAKATALSAASAPAPARQLCTMYQCPTCAAVVVGNLRRWPHYQYAKCPMTLCKQAPDAARMTDGVDIDAAGCRALFNRAPSFPVYTCLQCSVLVMLPQTNALPTWNICVCGTKLTSSTVTIERAQPLQLAL
jgi:hypothetical protein